MSLYSRRPVIQLPRSQSLGPEDLVEKVDRGRMDDLDRHIEHVLSRRDKVRRTAAGIWSFVKTRGSFYVSEISCPYALLSHGRTSKISNFFTTLFMSTWTGHHGNLWVPCRYVTWLVFIAKIVLQLFDVVLSVLGSGDSVFFGRLYPHRQ